MFTTIRLFTLNVFNFVWLHKFLLSFGFLSISLLAILGSAAVFYFMEPTSVVKNTRETNISSARATLSWTTDKPTRGIVLLSEDNHFPILPFLSDSVYKDDGEKNLSISGLYTTHHVTFNRLDPKQIYYYRIYQGWHKMSEGKLVTVSGIDSLPMPYPIYGKVVGADKKTPVVGALVYFWAKKGSTESAVLSTLTNIKGGWVIDASSLRTKDFADLFNLTKDIEERVVVDTGKGRVQATSKIDLDQPWPTIIYKDKASE